MVISLSFLIGEAFHLLLDLPDIALFFPFVQYDFIINDDPISGWIQSLLEDPLCITSELVGIIIIIFIILNNKLYTKRELIDYLKTAPEKSHFVEQIT